MLKVINRGKKVLVQRSKHRLPSSFSKSLFCLLEKIKYITSWGGLYFIKRERKDSKMQN